MVLEEKGEHESEVAGDLDGAEDWVSEGEGGYRGARK